MGGAYSTHGRDENCMQIFWLGNPNGRDHTENLGLDGKIILESS